MTRGRKIVLTLVLAPLVLVALLVAALFSSAVQTFAARKALAGQGSVEKVSVGLSGARIAGIEVSQPGLKISAPAFVAETPLLDLVRGRIDIRSVVARDIVIDYDPSLAVVTTSDDKKTPGPAKPFAGVFDAADIGGELRIQTLDVTGLVRIAGPQPVTARFALGGGGVAPGGTGKITLRVDTDAGAAGSVIITFDVAPTLDAAGRLNALSLVLQAAAKGGALANPAALSAELSAAREGAGEAYRAKLALADKTLLELDTRWTPGAERFPGTWKIALSDSDVKPFLPAFITPPVTRLDGAGELTLAGVDSLRVSGRLDVLVDALERLGLPELGAIKLASRFDLESTGDVHRVNAFDLSLASGDSPVLTVETRQSFGFDPSSGKLAPANPSAELAAIRLLGVPSVWLKPYVPAELVVTGPITAAFNARPSGDGFVVESTEPVRIGGLRYDTLAAVDAVTLDGVRVEQAPAGLTASVRALRVVAAGAELVSGELSATQKGDDPLVAKSTLKLDLAKLADQPVLRGQTRIAAGQAVLNLDATLADAIRATLGLQISGLRAAGLAGVLPVVDLRADVTSGQDGVLTLKLPLTVRNTTPARVSDLEIAATLTPGTPDQNLVAKLTSRELHVPDLQVFAALASDSTPVATQPAPASSAPSTGPLWAGYTGRIDFDLTRVVYAPGLEFPNTKGSIALTSEALTLEKIQTVLSPGGSLDLSGALRWLASSRTYALSADVNGRDVAVGPLLKALDPATTPALEGTYTVSGKVAGQGSDPVAAISAAAADLELNGRLGVVRAINLDTNRYAQAGNVVSGLAGLAGALSGNTRITERANQIAALNNIARRLANLSYDELAVNARRKADGSVEIGQLRLQGPDVMMAGAGSIQSLAGRGFLQQPLALALDLGTRGDFARDLAVLGVLKPAPEGASTDVFRTLTQPLTFDGTVGKVGTTHAVRFLAHSLGL